MIKGSWNFVCGCALCYNTCISDSAMSLWNIMLWSQVSPRPVGYSSSRLGFTTLLTSHVISMTFYSEREKSDRFCSDALISTRGSFTCCKSTTRDPWLYFPSDGSVCVPVPTHCTIACFGFHARWIDGVKCCLFSNHAPPGQTTLRVRWVSV